MHKNKNIQISLIDKQDIFIDIIWNFTQATLSSMLFI